MTRKKTHKGKESMPSAAKKLVIVQNNDAGARRLPPAPAARAGRIAAARSLLFAAGEPLDEATLARRLPDGVECEGCAGAAEGRIRHARRQSRARRQEVDVPHRRRFVVAADEADRRDPQAVARGGRDARDHRLSPAGDARRDRGNSRRRGGAGTLDVLLKTGWIRPRGRRKAPGRPITYGTTETFLSHFGLEEVGDLPGLDELKGAGLLEGNLPPGFAVPMPSDDTTLREDEDPLEPGDLDLGLAPPSSQSEK